MQQKTQRRSVRPVVQTGQAGLTMTSRSKMLKPKNHEVDEWKVVNTKIKGKKKNFKPTFDSLLSKYVNKKTKSRDRSSKVSAAPSLKQDRSRSHRSGYMSIVIKIGSIDVTINDQVGNKILDHGLATGVWPPSICC
jgi:hypothetical protein